MRKTILTIGAAIVLLGIGWSVLVPASPTPLTSKLSVTASFYPLGFFASEIGGEHVAVTTITPNGIEPHDYEPTAEDIIAIQKSALLILNGNSFEPWSANISKNIDPEKTTILEAGTGLTTSRDPHFWLSPVLAGDLAARIAESFMQIDPVNTESYRTNAVMLEEKLQSLDLEYQTGLASCAKKEIVTSHDAFGYLAEAYGLRQVPIAGLSPEATPTPQELASIATFAKEHKIKYIFFESLVAPDLAETIAEEVGAQTLVLNPIEGVAPGKDYFSEMRANLANLKIALECQSQ